LANGFSIQICWLDATGSQQGLSFLWRQQQLWILDEIRIHGMVDFTFGSICMEGVKKGVKKGERGRNSDTSICVLEM